MQHTRKGFVSQVYICPYVTTDAPGSDSPFITLNAVTLDLAGQPLQHIAAWPREYAELR